MLEHSSKRLLCLLRSEHDSEFMYGECTGSRVHPEECNGKGKQESLGAGVAVEFSRTQHR